MLPLLRSFARYELLEEMSRSAHALVFRARDITLGRFVALKMLREEEASCSSAARFRREAQLLARLHHPNIVDVFEVGDVGGRPYFTMPLIEGGSLEWAIHEGRFDSSTQAKLLAQVAAAVHFAHERGVVHRDLKPSNILLREDRTPVLTDFGIAHDITCEQRLTAAGELLGTPLYMAPELLLGNGRVPNPRSDVYALGAILYEMLARRAPFEATTFVDLSAQILHDRPIPPSYFDPLLDRTLERICLRCLEKRPEERYASALELKQDLEEIDVQSAQRVAQDCRSRTQRG